MNNFGAKNPNKINPPSSTRPSTATPSPSRSAHSFSPLSAHSHSVKYRSEPLTDCIPYLSAKIVQRRLKARADADAPVLEKTGVLMWNC